MDMRREPSGVKMVDEFDELDAEVFLQSVDDLTRTGLRNAILGGGARKTPPAYDIAEDFERFEVHGRN